MDPLKGTTHRLLAGSTFDLFVRLHDHLPSTFPQEKRVFCFPGNKFTREDDKMLRNLLSIIKRHGSKYMLVELYDNRYPKTDDRRLVVKILNGVVETNRIDHYRPMLERYPLPPQLN